MSSDIVDVVNDPNEPPIFKGDQGRTKTALLLTSIAFYESYGLIQRIDDGVCNPRECDSGKAFTLWQIHPGPTGVVLEPGALFHYARPNEDGLTGKELVEDREAAVRTALHMLRASYKATGSLRGYTGERYEKDAMKAKQRLTKAIDWLKENPLE